MRTRTRALAGSVAAVAALGAGGVVGTAPANAGPVSVTSAGVALTAGAPAVPNRVERTEVTFDRTVVAQLIRLGVRVRAVDAEQRGRGDDLRITFRAVRSSRPGVLEYRGGVLLDTERRPDLFLSRPMVDLRQDTVSFAVGRDRVTLLSFADRDEGRPGRPGDDRNGDRDRDGDRNDDGDRDRNGNGDDTQRGNQQGQPGSQQGAQQQGTQQRPGMPRAGTGGSVRTDGDRDVILRLTRDGEQLLDRALGTRWFWTGQPIARVDYRDR